MLDLLIHCAMVAACIAQWRLNRRLMRDNRASLDVISAVSATLAAMHAAESVTSTMVSDMADALAHRTSPVVRFQPEPTTRKAN